MRESFETWIAEVLYCVRFLPDRKAIRQELEAHYEDHVRDLERLGYDHQLARKRALGTMGDPVEVGQALDRVHKPWLGWLWLASKGILMLSCFLLLWTLPRITLDSLTPVQRVGDYEPEGFFISVGTHQNEPSLCGPHAGTELPPLSGPDIRSLYPMRRCGNIPPCPIPPVSRMTNIG